MRIACFCLAALLGAALPGPAGAQSPLPSDDVVAQQILRGLTRGLRLPRDQQGQPADAVPVTRLDPRGPVQAATTAQPHERGVSLMITFATGSAALTPSAEGVLASLGRALTQPELAGARIRIEGHTDTVGEAGMNQALSEARAAMVREYLVRRYAIPRERLETIGLGETALLVPTGDGRAEIRNRRVQVINLGN